MTVQNNVVAVRKGDDIVETTNRMNRTIDAGLPWPHIASKPRNDMRISKPKKQRKAFRP